MNGEVPAPEVVRPSLWLWSTVEYDGTGFFGFQIQPQGRTVQGELERALTQVSGRATRVVGAGRTDRGVHAQGQVVSFEVQWRHSLSDLQRALNAVLATDVAILRMGQAPEGFHPRFSATRRAYCYTLLNRPWRSPLERRTTWHLAQKLDVVRMAEASQHLLGTHDFAAFGRPPQGENTVRRVFRAEWHEQVPYLRFDIEADAFLYRMVRSVVGTLVQVGSGQMSLAEFQGILQSRDRSRVKKVAPPQGLCLMGVEYARHEGALW
jgi:tRNA pseudouridine38-40 synthase